MIKVFSHWIHWKTMSRIALDFILPSVCLILAISLWGPGGERARQAVFVYAVIFALAMVVFNFWLGLYSRTHSRSKAQTRARAALSLCVSIPIAYGIFSLLVISSENQKLLLFSGLAALFATLAHRVYTTHSGSGAMTHRVMIFGTGEAASSVGKALKKSGRDIQIVGFYPSPTDLETSSTEQHVLSRSQSLSDSACALRVDEIIIAVRERRGGILPLRELLDCKLSGVAVLDLSSYFERALGQIRLDSLRAGWLIFGEGFRQGVLRTSIKRLFDIVAASILVLLTLPLMAVTALFIVLEDGSPILYRQQRVGLNGRLFNVIKFRSMGNDAESDGKPRWAAADDDRTTRVGRIIRKLRIDELPQLFSVLSGDMSLVGPRPERPYFVDMLTRDIPFYAARHSVKPGVTGWAQVSYQYGASVDDSIQKLQYDLYYLKNHTLFLDIVILFETVGVVLTGKGAQ
ncbi:MAG: exopolysaccharide biosynthesis polyprenyl glycosylphosphotransferase [Proteobacteria bacterium]|nr:exopolysaccharide biosynthesis polyprenyl glycosylphosphotransferase [Pseudomonadota bacterium]